jgi:H+-transporting ATPase
MGSRRFCRFCTNAAGKLRVMLGVATLLGLMGVFESFGLLYPGERDFDLDRATIQTFLLDT